MSINDNSYSLYFKPADINPNFKKDKKLRLLNNYDDFISVLEENKDKKMIAIDTETRGLNANLSDFIVGFSFSFSDKDGYYVPLRHILGSNITAFVDKTEEWCKEYNCSVEDLPGILEENYISYIVSNGKYGKRDRDSNVKNILNIFCDFIKDKVILMYNALFDLNVFHVEGFDVLDWKVFEVMALIYNADSNFKDYRFNPRIKKGANLKDMAGYYLGAVSDTFEETVEGKGFDEHDPYDVYTYACLDSLYTFGLFNVLYPPLIKECKQAIMTDVNLVMPMFYYMSNPLTFDPKFIEDAYNETSRKKFDITKKLNNVFGFKVDTRKSKELEEAFKLTGLTTGAYSDKTGGMLVNKDALASLDEKLNLFMSKFKELLESEETYNFVVNKLRNNSLKSLKEYLLSNIISQEFPDFVLLLKNLNFPRIEDGKLNFENSPFFYYQFKSGTVTKLLMEISGVNKKLESYLEPMRGLKSGRFSYHIFFVASGRFSSGSSKDKERNSNVEKYFLGVSAQTLPKPKPQDYICFYNPDYDSKTDYSVLGWHFFPYKEEEGKVINISKYCKDIFSVYESKDYSESYKREGFNEGNLRRVVRVPSNDWLYVSVDYSQQELRVSGGLSGEPLYIKTFSTPGGDLHTETAKAIFGEENYDSSKRKIAKGVNFALQYGGNYNTLYRNIGEKFGLSLDDCKDIENKYLESTKILQVWKTKEVEKAKKQGGVVYNAFGRPRRLGYFLFHNSQDESLSWKLRTFGERSVPSHLVQGVCGDVLRKTLADLYHHLIKGNKDKIQFALTVHDQIDFYIRKDFFIEAMQKIMSIMETEIPGCVIPLTVEVDLGYSYGLNWTFSHNKDFTVWTPKK